LVRNDLSSTFVTERIPTKIKAEYHHVLGRDLLENKRLKVFRCLYRPERMKE
jgi:hypothetical protein